jgi:hypothetical protein
MIYLQPPRRWGKSLLLKEVYNKMEEFDPLRTNCFPVLITNKHANLDFIKNCKTGTKIPVFDICVNGMKRRVIGFVPSNEPPIYNYIKTDNGKLIGDVTIDWIENQYLLKNIIKEENENERI